MSPQELFFEATAILEVLQRPSVLTGGSEKLEDLSPEVPRRINQLVQKWIPPTMAGDGYADMLVVDKIKLIQFHSNAFVRSFPRGQEPICSHLGELCHYLKANFYIAAA